MIYSYESYEIMNKNLKDPIQSQAKKIENISLLGLIISICGSATLFVAFVLQDAVGYSIIGSQMQHFLET